MIWRCSTPRVVSEPSVTSVIEDDQGSRGADERSAISNPAGEEDGDVRFLLLSGNALLHFRLRLPSAHVNPAIGFARYSSYGRPSTSCQTLSSGRPSAAYSVAARLSVVCRSA